MVGRLTALITLCMFQAAAPSYGGQLAPVPQFPLALECALLAIAHAKKLPETEPAPEDQSQSNRCFHAVQDYARTHCPASGKTIWAQIGAVADTGISDDDTALRAACG